MVHDRVVQQSILVPKGPSQEVPVPPIPRNDFFQPSREMQIGGENDIVANVGGRRVLNQDPPSFLFFVKEKKYIVILLDGLERKLESFGLYLGLFNKESKVGRAGLPVMNINILMGIVSEMAG
jgi:hypothetical protein